MGIERFFNSLRKKDILQEGSISVDLKNKIDTDYLYVDFNSIIYTIVNEIEKELNMILYYIILCHEYFTLHSKYFFSLS